MFGGGGDESLTPVSVRKPIMDMLTPEKVKHAMDDIIENIDGEDLDIKTIEAKLTVVANGASAFQAAEAALETSREFDPKDAPMVGQLQSALADGTIGSRSSLGQHFGRFVKKDDEGKGYAKCKTWETKRKFRMDWAERKLDDLRATRTHERAYRRVDETKGVYVSFGTLVESYGVHYDRAAAVSAALRYAAKCVQMGGKWVGVDQMAEVQEFLKLRREHSEIMEESWRLCEEEISNRSLNTTAIDDNKDKAVGVNPVKDKAEVVCVNTSVRSAIEPAAPSAAKRQKVAGKGVKEAVENAAPKKKSKLDEAILVAVAVKKKYLALNSSATSLENLIQVDPKWMWARTSSVVGQLQAAKASCEKALDDGDIRRFVFEEFKNIKIEVGADTLLVLTERFNMMKPKVDNMEMVIKKLLDAHKSLK
jgi:hypothetical protein